MIKNYNIISHHFGTIKNIYFITYFVVIIVLKEYLLYLHILRMNFFKRIAVSQIYYRYVNKIPMFKKNNARFRKWNYYNK